MLKKYFISSVPWIGLDIQPNAIRLIQLRERRTEWSVLCMGEKVLELGVFAESQTPSWEKLQQALTELIVEKRLVGAHAAVALPVPWVRIRQIEVPQGLQHSEIEAEIYTALQKELMSKIEMLSLDFAEFPSHREDYVQLHFAAARKELVMQYVNCIEAAGLLVKIVDIDQHALARGAALNSLLKSNDFLIAAGLAMRERPLW